MFKSDDVTLLLKSSTSVTYRRREGVIYLCFNLPIHPLSLLSGHSALGSLIPPCLEYFPPRSRMSGFPEFRSHLSPPCLTTQSELTPHFLYVILDHSIQFHFLLCRNLDKIHLVYLFNCFPSKCSSMSLPDLFTAVFPAP